MYETHVTLVGNVLTRPEWRRTNNTQALLTTFKVASTSRRLDRGTGQWVDGHSLRLRVSCWRALASNVASSVLAGDPVIVSGRLFTRDWTDDEGQRRTAYELEATAVGHDLTRGRSRFERIRAATATSAVDEQQTPRFGGEETTSVPDEEAPARFDATPYEADEEPVEAPVAVPERAEGSDTVDALSGVGQDGQRDD